MSLPTVGLLTTPEPTAPRIAPLLQRLTRWCNVLYATGWERFDAWFATGPRARGLSVVLENQARVAVWVGDDADADRLLDAPHVVAVGQDPALIDGFGARGVLWPDGIDADRYRPVAPFVRARWRRRWGLPEPLVWSSDEEPAPAPADVHRTALALASAVAVTGRAALEALAWGAPVVTDAETADALGAADGQEVVVAPAGALSGAAARLGDDLRLAASLSRGGRRLIERRHDTSRPPAALASRLGLRGEVVDPALRVAACLDELWAPGNADIRLRAEGHTLARAAR